MPDAIMKTVGRYEILREVGRGGMAMVYLARQTDLDRFVALKELGAFHASDPSFAQRFLRESRVAGSLSHPNIVTVHDYFEHDGTPYIAMEYIERGSLRPYVGRMNLAQIGGVLEGLLAGLTNAESHGIVHRDLKPENLMVTADGRVKIADFGIAKATTKMQTGAFLTATGTTVGTPTYMAPEQAMAQDIGPWTDLYSVGCMAFELFTGNVPFHDSDAPMAILLRHVNEPIAPVKSLRPEVDPRISDWIEALLVKEPAARTQSANEAWDDFEEILLGLLGPRWRREARLVERAEEASNGSKPLTPAPFPGTSAGDVASEEFKSFAWGAPAADTGASAAPPMYTPPPSESTPSIPEPTVGPPTPMPSQAVPAPPAADPEPIAETGFVTFGTPAPPPPTDALIAPAEGTPADDAPSGFATSPGLGTASTTPTPSDLATPPADAAPTPPAPAGFDGSSGFAAPSGFSAPPEDLTPPAEAAPPKAFETYISPPPSRPPSSDPKLTPPPFEAAAPAPVESTPVEPAPAAPVIEPPPPQAADTMMPQSLRPEPPKKAPKPPKAPSAGGRNKLVIPAAIAGGVAVVAVIAAVALGGGGDDTPTPTATPQASSTPGAAIPVSASGIALKVPAGWSDGAGDAPDVPGLADGAATLGGEGGAIVFGRAVKSSFNSTLLPGPLLTNDTPEAQTAEIGDGAQALRHDGLQIAGKSSIVYSVPTSEGVATLACFAEGDTCSTIASSMQITEGKVFPVGPSEEYSGDVRRILGRLEKQEKSAASALNKAGKRTSQVAATSRLGSVYTGAASSFRKLDVSPADAFLNKQLFAALGAAGSAYKKAASEGRAKDRAGYKRQGSRALAFQKDMNDALEGLSAAGYKLPSGAAAAAKFTRLPTLKKDPKQASSSASTQTQTNNNPPATNNNPPATNNNPPATNNNPPATNNNPPATNDNPPPSNNNNDSGDSGVSGGGEG
jgi:serine/threonine protein kinase